MAKRSPTARDPRGDGKWIAYGASMLLMFAFFPWLHRLAISFYRSFIEAYVYRFEYADILVYPVLACILVVFFFGVSLVITFGSRMGLFGVFWKMGR